jgi:hypothetical protein
MSTLNVAQDWLMEMGARPGVPGRPVRPKQPAAPQAPAMRPNMQPPAQAGVRPAQQPTVEDVFDRARQALGEGMVSPVKKAVVQKFTASRLGQSKPVTMARKANTFKNKAVKVGEKIASTPDVIRKTVGY